MLPHRPNERCLLAATILLLVAASGAWGQTGDLEAFLAGIGGPDGEARRAAFEAAAQYGAGAVAPLGQILAGEDRAAARAARLALEAIVAHAGRPGAEAEARAVSAALIELVRSDQPAAATRLEIPLLGLVGADEAVPALAELLGDPELGEPARQALQRIPGPLAAQALLDALETSDGTLQIGLIHALGNRRETVALPRLLELATDRNEPEAVRLAALDSLGRIGDARAEPVLADAARTGRAVERGTAVDAYLRLGAVLRLAGEEDRARSIYEHALQWTRETGRRIAALTGIEAIGDPRSLAAVLAGMGDVDPLFRDKAVRLVDALSGGHALRVMLEALQTARPRAKAGLLLAIARTGDAAAGPRLLAALQDPDERVQAATALGLGELLVAEAEAPLLALAESGAEGVRVPALNSYLRLLAQQLEQGRTPELLGKYNRALGLATRDEERRLALAGIAVLAAPSSLALVEPLTERAETADAALRAYVAIGQTVAGQGQAQEAERIFRAALARGAPRDLANQCIEGLRALGVAVDFAREAGFVTAFWLCGPFTGDALFGTAFPPEQGVDLTHPVTWNGKQLPWTYYRTNDIQGAVNLLPLMDPNQNVAAYACAEVTVPAAQDVTLKIGSDDGVVCWLNGQKVHANDTARPLQVDEDSAEARLQAGANKLLLKIAQGGGDWGFCLRLVDRQGKPIPCEQRTQ